MNSKARRRVLYLQVFEGGCNDQQLITSTNYHALSFLHFQNCQSGIPLCLASLANTKILIWLRLRQDQVDDGDQSSEEAQDQREVVDWAHQEDRVAKRVDEVDQGLGAQVSAGKWPLQCLRWHCSCHGSQSTQRSRSSGFQASVVLLGLQESGRHQLPAHQECGSSQA